MKRANFLLLKENQSYGHDIIKIVTLAYCVAFIIIAYVDARIVYVTRLNTKPLSIEMKINFCSCNSCYPNFTVALLNLVY